MSVIIPKLSGRGGGMGVGKEESSEERLQIRSVARKGRMKLINSTVS